MTPPDIPDPRLREAAGLSGQGPQVLVRLVDVQPGLPPQLRLLPAEEELQHRGPTAGQLLRATGQAAEVLAPGPQREEGPGVGDVGLIQAPA